MSAAARPLIRAGKNLSSRLLSVDIYRGVVLAGMILVDNPGDDNHAYRLISHAEWNGWTPADLIFPSFVFLVGMSLVLAVQKRLAGGEPKRSIFLHVCRRSILLIAIGVLVNGFPVYELASWRWEGVLQRIAICYFFSAILVLWSDWKGVTAAAIVCLVGYWFLLRFVPVPGFGVPGRDIPFMDQDKNIVAVFDRKLFMGHLFNQTRDPEGILSTIPAVASCLFGVLSGYWLQSKRTDTRKAVTLAIFGAASFALGLLWNQWFPINKNLWTSSFVLLTGGFALAFFAFLYWLTEIKKLRDVWTLPFLVFGMNAIAGFVADALVYGPAYGFHTHLSNGKSVMWLEYADAQLSRLGMNPYNTSLLYSLLALAFGWALLWLLYRKQIFLKL